MIITREYTTMTCHLDTINNVIFAEFAPNLRVDIVKAKQMVTERIDLARGRTHYVIMDFSNVREVTPEAKEYLQRRDGGLKNILGAGFLANNLVSALIANIFIKSTTEFPTKFFSKKNDALQWIQKHQKNVLKKI